MDEDDGGGKMERSSSFARSFYRGAENPAGASGGGGDANFPVPRSRPRRQSRNRSGGSAAAAVAVADDETGAAYAAPGGDRANSWYAEALQQGGSVTDLDNMLGTKSEDQGNFAGFDDDEVLEQYRIMAQHEANLRVKENTGFDIVEYEKRRKLQGNEPTDKKELYGGGKKPKTRLPDPKKFISSTATPKTEEPPLPAPKLHTKFLYQAQARIPELCPGVAVRSGASVPNDEHVVRCLGCRNQLRVKLLAALVSCPECNTVSPASSTRR